MNWIFLTGEYPPDRGGVSAYTKTLEDQFVEEGHAVWVWSRSSTGDSSESPDLRLVRRPGNYRALGLLRLLRWLKRVPEPKIILLQYVPQAFGFKGLNLLFAMWVALLQRQTVWVMFHEVKVFAGPSDRWQLRMLDKGTTAMLALVCRRTARAFVSIPKWAPVVRSYVKPQTPVTWLPVPTNIATTTQAEVVHRLRRELSGSSEETLLGHFGTYSEPVRSMLVELLVEILKSPLSCRIVLLGANGDDLKNELSRTFAASSLDRISAPGFQDAQTLACWVQACDVMVQPYPDGISTRRGSAMASLALGRPMVTNVGHLSEPFWADCGAIDVANSPTPSDMIVRLQTVMGDSRYRAQLGRAALDLYRSEFSVERTVTELLSAVQSA